MFIIVSTSILAADIIRTHIITLDYNTISTISQLDYYVKNDFYYSIDKGDFNDSILEGYVNGLGDKYAEYYSKADASIHSDSLNGNAYGIGVMCLNTKESDGIYIWKTYKDGPANLSGIKAGDIITHIDNISVKELGYDKALTEIKKDKKLNLTIIRNKEKFNVKIKPSKYDLQSVYEKTLEGNIGYIQVITFNNKTYPQFIAAIDGLKKENIKGLIIDLRHNGGGTVDSAAKMLDYILPKGDTIRVKDNSGKITVRNKSDKKAINIPLAVLVDGNTASAAEIFACAVRDFNRGVLIGTKTYGKSVIQRSYELSNGGKAKFTIAEFVDKNGNSFNEIGLEPDIKVFEKDITDYEYYFLNYNNDKVLQRAVEYLS